MANQLLSPFIECYTVTFTIEQKAKYIISWTCKMCYFNSSLTKASLRATLHQSTAHENSLLGKSRCDNSVEWQLLWQLPTIHCWQLCMTIQCIVSDANCAYNMFQCCVLKQVWVTFFSLVQMVPSNCSLPLQVPLCYKASWKEFM